LDVVLLVVAAPVLLLIGVPARGYLISAGAWIGLRAIGVLVDRVALAMTSAKGEISLRLAYLFGRLIGLAVIAIVLRQSAGRNAGVTALLVILFAFSVELILSVIYRPRRP